MRKVIKAIENLLVWLVQFWKWGIWKRSFWKGKTEYYIPFLALAAWIGFEVGGRIFGWHTYPVGYFQKITFGILGMSIISGVGWLWIGVKFPKLKVLIDPDTINVQNLSLWQKIRISLFFYSLYVVGAVVLASLY